MALNYQEGHFHNERWFSLTLDLLLTLRSHTIDEPEMWNFSRQRSNIYYLESEKKITNFQTPWAYPPPPNQLTTVVS